MKKLLSKLLLSSLVLLNACTFQQVSTNFKPIRNNLSVTVLVDKFEKPRTLDIDKDGNLYVLVQDGKLIKKMDYKTEVISDFIDFSKENYLIDLIVKDYEEVIKS